MVLWVNNWYVCKNIFSCQGIELKVRLSLSAYSLKRKENKMANEWNFLKSLNTTIRKKLDESMLEYQEFYNSIMNEIKHSFNKISKLEISVKLILTFVIEWRLLSQWLIKRKNVF